MGGVSSTMTNALMEKQRELQAEMQEKQMGNMLRSNERMRRLQVAQQLAIARERFWWYASAYSLLLAGVVGASVKQKKIPRAAGLIIIPTIFVIYQYDYAYGNKVERINRMTENIIRHENHWFTPITPSDKEVAELKRK